MIKLEEKFNKYYESLLNEVEKFDRKNLNVSIDNVYKFLESPQDLYTALKSNTIWSAFYDDENDGQYDAYCKELEQNTGIKYEYLCLTTEPTKVALEFKRPFGIAFNSGKLQKYINDKGYYYKSFNQFNVKTKVAEKDIKNRNNCLTLGTVGKFKNGTYFFTPQGGYEPRLIKEDTYKQLVSWLKQNSGNQLIHFINNVDDPLKGDKGKKYIYKVGDFIAPDSTVELTSKTKTVKTTDETGKEIKETKVVPIFTNSCFLTPEAYAGLQFRREFRDIAEIYAVVLNKSLGLKAAHQDAYKTHIYNAKIPPIVDPKLNPNSTHNLSQEVYDELGDALNEYEYRIYLPYEQDFKFTTNLIDELKLPTVFELVVDSRHTRYIDLKDLFEKFDQSNSIEEMFNICDVMEINHETTIKQLINLYKIIKAKNLNYLFYEYAIGVNSNTSKYYNINKTIEDTYDKIPNKLVHSRFIANKGSLESALSSSVYDWDENPIEGPLPQDIQVIKIADTNGYPTLIYRNFSPSNDGTKEACARIGVEGIVLGQDENESWYLRLMYKHDGVCELPGGSLDSLNNLKAKAKEKLSDEVGFNLSNINGPIDTIYMYEDPEKPLDKTIKKKLNKMKLQYPYSAYLLFTSIVSNTINANEKHYYGTAGEKARWILVDSLETDTSFMSRYANILSTIYNIIK